MFLEYFIPTLAILTGIATPIILVLVVAALKQTIDEFFSDAHRISREREDKIADLLCSQYWKLDKISQPPNDKMITLHFSNNSAGNELDISIYKEQLTGSHYAN